MDVTRFIINFILLNLTLSVKYRFEPPTNPIILGQPIFNQKPQQIRRKFRNQAQLESSQIRFCLDFDYIQKVCSKCFDGFLLQNKTCIVDTNFNPKRQSKQLSYILKQSPTIQDNQTSAIMLNRNPFCASTTTNGAFCLSCHPGFILLEGNCIQNQDEFTLAEQLYLRPMQAPKNTFCRSFNEQGVCISCFPQADFLDNLTNQCVIRTQHRLDCRLHQLCVPQSTQCLTYSSQGFCKSCPRQSININGVCRINKPQSLCVKIGQDSKCLKCSKFGQLKDGMCRFKSPYCLEYNADSTCNMCTPTYRRVNGQCIRPSKVMFVNADPYCATWRRGQCIQCKFGYGFHQQYCHLIDEILASGHTPDPDPIKHQQII